MGRALLAAAGQELDSPALALLAQLAEHHFPKVMCGIMDQMIVANGQRDHAMLLDCRSLERIYLPIDSRDLRVVITNSMHKHALAGDADTVTMPTGEVHHGTPYNMRRLACETGVKAIATNYPHVEALRDATMPMLDGAKPMLNDLIYRRCRHVITENDRCEQFAAFMRESRYDEAGALMVESHNSLRDDYEVSAEPLDFLAAEAMKIKGVYGSRMTGAGFGGCTVSLVQPRAVDAFTKQITAAYEAKYKKTPQVIVTTATDGARVI
jgi:galactokinase